MKKYPPVIDVCCGGRMMWFDKKDERSLFMDIRRETIEVNEAAAAKGFKSIVVDPDVLGDFTKMDFPNETFYLVVFDPPHLTRCGDGSYMGKAYGKLLPDWEDTLRTGFSECFRVLRTGGTLIFKWNETRFPLSRVLSLTNEKPLFGNKTGSRGKTHWVAFIKGGLIPLALDGGDSAASQAVSAPEVLSTLQGESTPAHRK